MPSVFDSVQHLYDRENCGNGSSTSAKGDFSIFGRKPAPRWISSSSGAARCCPSKSNGRKIRPSPTRGICGPSWTNTPPGPTTAGSCAAAKRRSRWMSGSPRCRGFAYNPDARVVRHGGPIGVSGNSSKEARPGLPLDTPCIPKLSAAERGIYPAGRWKRVEVSPHAAFATHAPEDSGPLPASPTTFQGAQCVLTRSWDGSRKGQLLLLKWSASQAFTAWVSSSSSKGTSIGLGRSADRHSSRRLGRSAIRACPSALFH